MIPLQIANPNPLPPLCLVRPMMGKENIGNLAKTLDSILKKIISGQKVDGFFEPLSMSIEQMTTMNKPHDLGEVQRQVSDIASKIVD